MTKAAPSTIKLRTNGNDFQQELKLNAVVTAVKPGHLVTLSSGLVIPNASAADVDPEVMVALEMDILGRTIDTTYSVSGESVLVWWPQPGDYAYMFLKTGNNVAVGASLESGGAGNLQALSTGKHIFTALEAINNASGADVRIKVRRV